MFNILVRTTVRVMILIGNVLLQVLPRTLRADCNRFLLSNTHTRTHTFRDMNIHTRTRSAVKSTGRYSRGFGDFEESNGCRAVVETSSHAPRKVTAVSLSSTSSAAVASILPREKSLMESPSTTFQVLFLIITGKEYMRSLGTP